MPLIVGTDGNDVLTGTAGDDHIAGGSGDDVLEGLGGNDELIGGPGNDVLHGGAGNDRIEFDPDDSPGSVTGGTGHDVLVGFGVSSLDFDLGAAGFEGAELYYSRRPFTNSLTHFYDQNWKLLQAIGKDAFLNAVYIVDYDPYNTRVENVVATSYQFGNLEFVDIYKDDGY